MKKLLLLQGTLVRSGTKSDKLIYLVQIDQDLVRQEQGEGSDDAALETALRAAKAAITSAFPSFILIWESPVEMETDLPNYDPIYKMDGIEVWMVPVVSNNEAYFYLVG